MQQLALSKHSLQGKHDLDPHGNGELTCCFYTAFQEALLQPCMGSLLLF